MKQLLVLIGLSLLVSCGHTDHMRIEGSNLPQDGGIAVEASQIVTKFENEYNLTVDYPVTIKQDLVDYSKEDGSLLPQHVDGVCWTSTNGDRIIEIRQSRWDSMSNPAREQIMLHELGHCSLDRGHDSSMRTDKTYCPKTIMNPYTFDNFEINHCFSPDKGYYLDELGE